MANPPLLIIAGKNDQGSEDISVKIDPSIPLLTAMIRLFRSQGQSRQAAEICRLGLDFFPNHNEITPAAGLMPAGSGRNVRGRGGIKRAGFGT